MGPFFLTFQKLQTQGMSPDEALLNIRDIVRQPGAQEVLAELAASEMGRSLLAEWRQSWLARGYTPPWEEEP